MRKFLPLVLLSTVLGVAAILAALGDSSISATVLGWPLTITTSQQFAGAINSLSFRGAQFVNHNDHGREIQSAISFNDFFECYNPTEAGSADDGAGLTSRSLLISLTRTSNSLTTSNQMAYWIRGNQTGSCGNPTTTPVPGLGTPRSDVKVNKAVTIGYGGISNVIEYLTTFTMAPNPPVPVNKGQAQAVVAVLNNDPQAYDQGHPPSAYFSSVWTYDVATRNYLENQLLKSQGDDTVKVLRDPIKSLAIAFYSPELLQRYENFACSGFRWDLDPTHAISSLGDLRMFGPQAPSATLSYRGYFVVGNDDEVQDALKNLHNNFASQDPEVFSWREYLYLNPTLPYSDQTGAQNHWLNWGIGEARAGSYKFAPSQYLQLNPDVAGAYGSTNYAAAIDHYIRDGRKEGRTTTPRAEGGNQHTTVRSPQVGAVVVKAAGQNANGQLGNGTTIGSAFPVQTSAFPARVTEVAAGEYTSVAVLANGTVWTWGSNTYGARGNNTIGGQDLSPRQVPGLSNVVTPSTKDRHVVSAGLSAVAVVDNTGRVLTWGANWNGQLGDGTTTPHYIPAPVKKTNGTELNGIVSISIGQSHMVALDVDGNVWAWGAGASGALGNNSTADSYRAIQVDPTHNVIPPPPVGVSQVICGGSSFCLAVTRGGALIGWGNNGSGQLGIGTTAYTTVPVTIPVPVFVERVAAGAYHSLARGRDGNVWVWGYNGWGQLGNPQAAVNQRSPILMSSSTGMSGITDVAAGFYFSLMSRATAYDRTIFAVGDNQSGQLGINNHTQQNQPVQTSF